MRRMKWQPKGSNNTWHSNSVAPRITVILAVDSEGKAYLSLLQANTDDEIMMLYWEHFVEKLND